MKILLDECVTKRLKSGLGNHEVISVAQMKWNGIKNGKLLGLCVENSFDILLTIDKNMMFNNILPISTSQLLFSTPQQVKELVLFIPSFERQIKQFEKKKAYLIDK